MRHPLAKLSFAVVTFVFAYAFGTTWLASSVSDPALEAARALPFRPRVEAIPARPQVEAIPARHKVEATPGPVPAEFPPEGQKLFGVTTESGPYRLAELDNFARAAGKDPDLLMYVQDWANHPFRADLLDAVLDWGALPLVSWEPRDATKESPVEHHRGEQPKFALSRILDGTYDEYIKEWANGIADWGRPVLLRFAHEMNGDWYPWSEQVNGNESGEYVKAWRYVHDFFERAGADNVTWIWSPNIAYEGSTPIDKLYPGDDYVDWAGVVGFFGHTARVPTSWPTFDELYGPTIEHIRALTDKKILITEMGATEWGDFKDEFIEAFLEELPKRDRLNGFVWFEVEKETDWRIVSSESARRAFAEGVSDARYGVDVPKVLSLR